MNTIKKLSDQYDKINTTQNKLDTNLINNRNNKLFKEMDLVTEKLNKLKNVEKEHRKLEGQVSTNMGSNILYNILCNNSFGK
jgi:hypothetical protein